MFCLDSAKGVKLENGRGRERRASMAKIRHPQPGALVRRSHQEKKIEPEFSVWAASHSSRGQLIRCPVRDRITRVQRSEPDEGEPAPHSVGLRRCSAVSAINMCVHLGEHPPRGRGDPWTADVWRATTVRARRKSRQWRLVQSWEQRPGNVGRLVRQLETFRQGD